MSPALIVMCAFKIINLDNLLVFVTGACLAHQKVKIVQNTLSFNYLIHACTMSHFLLLHKLFTYNALYQSSIQSTQVGPDGTKDKVELGPYTSSYFIFTRL